MRPAPILCLAVLLALPACSVPGPTLEQMTSAEALAAPYPDLVPLGPLLASAEGLAPRSADVEGISLEARAASLRYRAARLRALAL